MSKLRNQVFCAYLNGNHFITEGSDFIAICDIKRIHYMFVMLLNFGISMKFQLFRYDFDKTKTSDLQKRNPFTIALWVYLILYPFNNQLTWLPISTNPEKLSEIVLSLSNIKFFLLLCFFSLTSSIANCSSWQ